MSKSTVNQVVQRAISDAAFRRQLQSDPHKALKGFDLSADERSAITAGDPARLTALGVDQRMSKAFSLGALSDASKVVVDDGGAGGVGSAIFIDDGGSGSGGNAAIVSGNVDASSPLGTMVIDEGSISGSSSATVDAGETAAQRHLRFGEQDLDASSSATEFEAAGAPGTMAIDEGSVSGGLVVSDDAGESAAARHLRMVEQDLDAPSTESADTGAPDAGATPTEY